MHVKRASIVSGYFGPIHHGHLDLFEAARLRNGYLIVIVNSDAQQLAKKGRVIQSAENRARIVRSLRCVDDVVVSVDESKGIDRSFDVVRERYPFTELEFCNGGDQTDVNLIPREEVDSARRNNITMLYGIGGRDKADASSRIIGTLGESELESLFAGEANGLARPEGN